MKLYTKTGDEGETSLFNGQRVPKTHPILDALGDVDELNSLVGLAREYVLQQDDKSPLLSQLEFIQSRLLDAGSAIATPRSGSSESLINKTSFDVTASQQLEVIHTKTLLATT